MRSAECGMNLERANERTAAVLSRSVSYCNRARENFGLTQWSLPVRLSTAAVHSFWRDAPEFKAAILLASIPIITILIVK